MVEFYALNYKYVCILFFVLDQKIVKINIKKKNICKSQTKILHASVNVEPEEQVNNINSCEDNNNFSAVLVVVFSISA